MTYKSDGEMVNFGQTVSAAKYLLDWMEKAADPIIAGIANTDGNRDMSALGADKFIQFLKVELIPFTDKAMMCENGLERK